MRKYETKRSKELRIKRQKRSNAIAMFSAIAVVFLLSIVIWKGKQSLVEKDNLNVFKIQELDQKMEEQEARSISLVEYKKYIQTKKYVEQIAKEKFGLINPNEIIFKPSSSN